jgi:hypothetical protein
MSASGQSWKQEVSVPCVRSITPLTRRVHPLRFAGRFGSADRLLECRLCESGGLLDIRPGPTLMGSHEPNPYLRADRVLTMLRSERCPVPW